MEKLIIIRTPAELDELRSYLDAFEYVAFDTETTGVDKESTIIGFSVSGEVDVGFYVILQYWDKDNQKLVAYMYPKLKEFLEYLTTKKLIMHNGVFDCWMVNNNFKVDLLPALHTDTMILGHLLDENRSNGLKELAVSIFGESSKKEQLEMKASVEANGGVLTKEAYELYKADADLIARYGAKDTILTLRLFYIFIEQLYEQGLDKFFYEDESMPLLKTGTYDLNTVGLKVDTDKLAKLQVELEADILEAKGYIHKEIEKYVKSKYPGTKPKNTFNLNSGEQMSWLLFHVLKNEFHLLTKVGKEICKFLDLPLPYTRKAKLQFIEACSRSKGVVYKPEYFDKKKNKKVKAKKIGDYWKYISCGKETLTKLSPNHKWIVEYAKYKKNEKLLNTYVIGIRERAKYGIIRPSFLQHGTTSGRYSCKNPNFQNLPRDDKRIKSCITARPGKIFVGADYAQLEPRIFASQSKDRRLCDGFSKGEDFYSLIGIETFEKPEALALKEGHKNAFGVLYPELRNISKTIALSATYGTTAYKMAPLIKKSTDEAQEVIDSYFKKFPLVKKFMLEAHEQAKTNGVVYNLFGRPRRIPKALKIKQVFGNKKHEDLPYEYRNLLNLAVNHPIQSTAASIMNRAAIAVKKACITLSEHDSLWLEVKIILQVHDDLVIEGPEKLKDDMIELLKYCMEETTKLPGVDLVAEPKAGKNLAELK